METSRSVVDACLRIERGYSIVLACLVGILVMLQAYVFTGMIVQ
jgi:hypothetical protein